MPQRDVKQSERAIYNRGYGTSDILPDRELMARHAVAARPLVGSAACQASAWCPRS
jgi:hypothetical protein